MLVPTLPSGGARPVKVPLMTVDPLVMVKLPVSACSGAVFAGNPYWLWPWPVSAWGPTVKDPVIDNLPGNGPETGPPPENCGVEFAAGSHPGGFWGPSPWLNIG